jgi:hypothetical protein
MECGMKPESRVDICHHMIVCYCFVVFGLSFNIWHYQAIRDILLSQEQAFGDWSDGLKGFLNSLKLNELVLKTKFIQRSKNKKGQAPRLY